MDGPLVDIRESDIGPTYLSSTQTLTANLSDTTLQEHNNMVATRSKTRSSTGGEDNQPKIDDALDTATTGRKRRSSKATKTDGETGSSKKEPNTKKRKTEETTEGKEEEGDLAMRDDGKEVIEVENANDASTNDAGGAKETLVDGPEQHNEASQDVDQVDAGKKEESTDMAIDSSRVDLDSQVETAGVKEQGDVAESERVSSKEQTGGSASKEKDVDAVANQGESNSGTEAAQEKTAGVADEEKPQEPTTGATDMQEVKEAEKDLVQHDNVTEYGTIHFLYKPKVCPRLAASSPIHTVSLSALLIPVMALQVEVLHPGSVDEIQRLHIILQPHKQEDPAGKPVLSRMLHIGRKVLPAAGKGRRQP